MCQIKVTKDEVALANGHSLLADEEFAKMFEGGFPRTIEHMDVVVAGISEVPGDLPTYASCSAVLFKLIAKSAFSVVKISSEEFNDLLDRFTMAFHIIKGIKFTVVTKLKVNTCTEDKIVNMCLDLNITYMSSDNGIAYMKLHNFTRNTKCILTLELSTGVIHGDHMHILH